MLRALPRPPSTGRPFLGGALPHAEPAASEGAPLMWLYRNGHSQSQNTPSFEGALRAPHHTVTIIPSHTVTIIPLHTVIIIPLHTVTTLKVLFVPWLESGNGYNDHVAFGDRQAMRVYLTRGRCATQGHTSNVHTSNVHTRPTCKNTGSVDRVR